MIREQQAIETISVKKESVFERLYRMRKPFDTVSREDRPKDAATMSRAMVKGTLPARSTKPLTVPQEFHFRTEQRIAMKQQGKSDVCLP
jgi:hypothetical protein